MMLESMVWQRIPCGMGRLVSRNSLHAGEDGSSVDDKVLSMSPSIRATRLRRESITSSKFVCERRGRDGGWKSIVGDEGGEVEEEKVTPFCSVLVFRAKPTPDRHMGVLRVFVDIMPVD